jgi:hypothetical protein
VSEGKCLHRFAILKPPPTIILHKGEETWAVRRKEAKDFYLSAAPMIEAMAGILPLAPGIKVFWFFSSEKNVL